MTAISDAVVIGLVLTLVFAAVSYYLYSQIGQLSHKVGLMENILLDLKVTTEQAVLASSEPLELSADERLAHESFHSAGGFVSSPGAAIAALATATTTAEASTPSGGETRELFVESRSRSEQSTGNTVQVERTGAAAAAETSPSTDVPSLSVNYEAMTYKELLVVARQKSIHGTRTMTKAQLIEALRGASGEPLKKEETASLAAWTTSGQVSFGDELGSAHDAAEGSIGGVMSLDDTNAGEINL